MKGKVLYSAFDVVPGPKGASTHILHFLRGLVNGGYQVQLITPGDGLLPGSGTIEGASVIRVPPNGDHNFLSRAAAFGQAVLNHVEDQAQEGKTPYDIVHYRSIWSGFPLAQAKNKYGYKTLYEVNGLPSMEIKYHYPNFKDAALLKKIREQELATLMLSDGIICVSEVTRMFLTSLGVPRKRITVIPNGASIREHPPAPPSSIQETSLPVILYIGTLADWQGLDTLIDAMQLVLASNPAQLHIIGRGRSRQRKILRKRIRKLGLEESVHLLAPQPHHQIHETISRADICVAPLGLNDRNIVQGCCPIKVLEYMAAGRPIVASNIPVVREILRQDIDGLLFWPDNPQDLAVQIMTLLSDKVLAGRLADNAAEHARTSYTWHLARKRLLKFYAAL